MHVESLNKVVKHKLLRKKTMEKMHVPKNTDEFQQRTC